MAEQHLGNGTVFTFTDVGGSVRTLGNVISIEGPEPERETVDSTVLGSTTPWRTFIVGDGDPGSVTMQVIYDSQDDAQIHLNAVLASGSTIVNFVLNYNSSMDNDTFSGYIVGRGRTIERNGLIQGPVTIKVSSDPGFATST